MFCSEILDLKTVKYKHHSIASLFLSFISYIHKINAYNLPVIYERNVNVSFNLEVK